MRPEYTEIKKLAGMLLEANIPFSTYYYLEGMQIRYFDKNGLQVCSVIENDVSYGNRADLLEIMGLCNSEDSVEGYLTADTVFNRIQNHYAKNI